MKKRLLVLGSLVCALALLCACHRGGGPAPASPAVTPGPSTAPTPAPSETPDLSPAPSPSESPAWAAAYAETVTALAQEEPGLTYDLIYVDDNDVPELVADMTGYYMYLYTYADGQVHTLMDGWGYGAAGIPGYEYIPRANVIYNRNVDFAGAMYYEFYMKIGVEGQLEDYYDQALTLWNFDDLNGNGSPDEGELLEEPIYRYGDQVISEAEFDAYQIPGTYEMIQGAMTQDQVLEAL